LDEAFFKAAIGFVGGNDEVLLDGGGGSNRFEAAFSFI
jgi:hypothetical protein